MFFFYAFPSHTLPRYNFLFIRINVINIIISFYAQNNYTCLIRKTKSKIWISAPYLQICPKYSYSSIKRVAHSRALNRFQIQKKMFRKLDNNSDGIRNGMPYESSWIHYTITVSKLLNARCLKLNVYVCIHTLATIGCHGC